MGKAGKRSAVGRQLDSRQPIAGGYAIQGLAGCFVQKLTGSYTSVVGLPLTEVVSMLVGEGFPIHFAWVRAAELDPT